MNAAGPCAREDLIIPTALGQLGPCLTVDLVIKHVTMVLPYHDAVYGSIAVDEGKIVSICSDTLAPKADIYIDGHRNVVLPGVVDPHTHLGFYRRLEDDFAVETASAGVGGVTTLINYYRENGSYKTAFPPVRDVASKNSLLDFSFHLGVTNQLHIDELAEYVNLFGITSYKLYLDYKNTDTRTAARSRLSIDDGFVYRVMEKLGRMNLGVKACAHCENAEIIRDLTNEIQKSRVDDLKGWAASRPGFTEAETVLRMIYLSRVTGASLHIVHVSANETVDVLREARRNHIAVGAETQVHYLTQTKHSSAGILAKVKPPLRTQEDLEAVWTAISEGLVTCVSSDHVPCMKAEKIGSGDIWSALMGFPSSPLILPLLISEGLHKGRVTLQKIAQITSSNAAKSFGLYPKKGSLQIGSDADLVLVDLNKEEKVTTELLRSGCDFTIYEGWKVRGWPLMTLVRGNIVFHDGEITGKPGWGVYLPRNSRYD